MTINENVALSDYSTMGLGGVARYLCTVTSRAELTEAITFAKQHQLKTIMIGGGSNIIWRDEGFAGLVIVNGLTGYEISAQDDENNYVRVGAGENWDATVMHTVSDGLTGIEALSLIPGSVGATPVQNVGAYGQEVSQTLATVEAYDTVLNDYVIIRGFDCGFSYRTSRFNTTERERFYITAVTFNLRKGLPATPFYPAVQKYFDDQAITTIDAAAVRSAVIAIRSAKLPDPKLVRNNGSFFGNPVVTRQQYENIALIHPDVLHWIVENGVKLSAAWLIEKAGFKDYHDPGTGMATWPAQPLVLVNEAATSTAQLLEFKAKLVDSVAGQFGVTLVQEPELLPY